MLSLSHETHCYNELEKCSICEKFYCNASLSSVPFLYAKFLSATLPLHSGTSLLDRSSHGCDEELSIFSLLWALPGVRYYRRSLILRSGVALSHNGEKGWIEGSFTSYTMC